MLTPAAPANPAAQSQRGGARRYAIQDSNTRPRQHAVGQHRTRWRDDGSQQPRFQRCLRRRRNSGAVFNPAATHATDKFTAWSRSTAAEACASCTAAVPRARALRTAASLLDGGDGRPGAMFEYDIETARRATRTAHTPDLKVDPRSMRARMHAGALHPFPGSRACLLTLPCGRVEADEGRLEVKACLRIQLDGPRQRPTLRHARSQGQDARPVGPAAACA